MTLWIKAFMRDPTEDDLAMSQAMNQAMARVRLLWNPGLPG